MTTDLWIVNLAGLPTVAWIVCYFWLQRKEGIAASVVYVERDGGLRRDQTIGEAPGR